MIPFSSERKRMTVAYQLPGEDGTVRVVVKGAPEYIVKLCTKELDQNDDPQDFEGDGEPGQNYLTVTVADGIAKLGQKPISFAYRDFNQDEFENLYNTHQKFETEESRFHIESQLTLVATLGLIDPLREGCVDAINRLYDANTNTRILSGDHKESVLKTAREIGIADNNNEEGVMSGEEIRSELSSLLIKTEDEVEGGYTYKFKSEDAK
jgi:magnesium-transporting ATPase (P-type)